MRGATLWNKISFALEVSIHAPHARGDILWRLITNRNSFNSRPSCEGRQRRAGRGRAPDVSIHAPHARGDTRAGGQASRLCFNSRPSCEGRPTVEDLLGDIKFQFTPLMRGATVFGVIIFLFGCFNSRPSCEGRLGSIAFITLAWFQFTPLMRGATIL